MRLGDDDGVTRTRPNPKGPPLRLKHGPRAAAWVARLHGSGRTPLALEAAFSKAGQGLKCRQCQGVPKSANNPKPLGDRRGRNPAGAALPRGSRPRACFKTSPTNLLEISHLAPTASGSPGESLFFRDGILFFQDLRRSVTDRSPAEQRTAWIREDGTLLTLKARRRADFACQFSARNGQCLRGLPNAGRARHSSKSAKNPAGPFNP